MLLKYPEGIINTNNYKFFKVDSLKDESSGLWCIVVQLSKGTFFRKAIKEIIAWSDDYSDLYCLDDIIYQAYVNNMPDASIDSYYSKDEASKRAVKYNAEVMKEGNMLVHYIDGVINVKNEERFKLVIENRMDIAYYLKAILSHPTFFKDAKTEILAWNKDKDKLESLKKDILETLQGGKDFTIPYEEYKFRSAEEFKEGK